MAFVVRINNWRRKQKNNESKKVEQQKHKLHDMQKPTSEAIREQLSNEAAELLSGLVVEAAWKTSSSYKYKEENQFGTNYQISTEH